MNTEHRKKTLQRAIGELASYEPNDMIWLRIEEGLKEVPLQNAIGKLPDYEPEHSIWNGIEDKISPKNVTRTTWWFAAVALLVAGYLGILKWQSEQTDQISYSQETVDFRLLLVNENSVDNQYEKLKAYCEEEALVCASKNFKRLKEEYETLSEAAAQLQQAMGQYNTEPELIRQFAALEREKAELLNEMAKLI